MLTVPILSGAKSIGSAKNRTAIFSTTNTRKHATMVEKKSKNLAVQLIAKTVKPKKKKQFLFSFFYIVESHFKEIFLYIGSVWIQLIFVKTENTVVK